MANIKSQIKRNLTNEKAHQANVAYKSALKTSVKKVEALVAAKDLEAAKVALANTVSAIDEGASKGVISKNAASRMKSHLSLAVNSIAA